MVMNFSKEDKAFMNIAIEEAKHSLKEGDFPVGAVLTIDDKMIDKSGNSIHSNKDWVSHAEMKLLLKYSSMIKGKIKMGRS